MAIKGFNCLDYARNKPGMYQIVNLYDKWKEQ